MKSTRKANSVTSVQAGMNGPQAPNTAPGVTAAVGIAGYGAPKLATPATGPTMSGGPSGFNPPKDSPACGAKSGGPANAGPGWTQGGTRSPKQSSGPGGIGESGGQYPGIGS